MAVPTATAVMVKAVTATAAMVKAAAEMQKVAMRKVVEVWGEGGGGERARCPAASSSLWSAGNAAAPSARRASSSTIRPASGVERAFATLACSSSSSNTREVRNLLQVGKTAAETERPSRSLTPPLRMGIFLRTARACSRGLTALQQNYRLFWLKSDGYSYGTIDCTLGMRDTTRVSTIGGLERYRSHCSV